MPQMNMHVTPDFARDLRRVMRARKYRSKSDAIRDAVRALAAKVESESKPFDFRSLAGIAKKGPRNRKPRFPDDASLWKKG